MEHDFPAAADYRDLLLEPGEVRRLNGALRTAPTRPLKAKGILRASGLLLPKDNVHIRHDIRKVKSDKKLSPCSCARHPAGHRGRLSPGVRRTHTTSRRASWCRVGSPAADEVTTAGLTTELGRPVTVAGPARDGYNVALPLVQSPGRTSHDEGSRIALFSPAR
ncbi:hypothetical protein [Streptomyces sp. WAC 06725]|uniref:hypothetical protein n=1 Tax=Streptomyces sp. WAC 06725 TaxID=2203209 RepID=UPI001C8C2DE8|nr:hypothetical protein [Streptomyces sp. WAC 06725]